MLQDAIRCPEPVRWPQHLDGCCRHHAPKEFQAAVRHEQSVSWPSTIGEKIFSSTAPAARRGPLWLCDVPRVPPECWLWDCKKCTLSRSMPHSSQNALRMRIIQRIRPAMPEDTSCFPEACLPARAAPGTSLWSRVGFHYRDEMLRLDAAPRTSECYRRFSTRTKEPSVHCP